jgi:hypothetical protein
MKRTKDESYTIDTNWTIIYCTLNGVVRLDIAIFIYKYYYYYYRELYSAKVSELLKLLFSVSKSYNLLKYH